MSREMVRMKMTHKRLSLLAKECDEQAADEKMLHLMTEYTLDQIVWIDEFGKRKKPPQR